MKIRSFLFVLIIQVIFLLPSTSAEIELFYKTADGQLKISGFDELKPFSVSNGKKKYLSDQGVFSITGSPEEIVQYGFFPLGFSREYLNSGIFDTSASSDVEVGQKISTTLTFLVSSSKNNSLKSRLRNSILPIHDDFWEGELSEQIMFVVVWIDPNENTHASALMRWDISILNDTKHSFTWKSFTKTSVEKLIPVVLVIDQDGRFRKAKFKHGEHSEWESALISLIRDDAVSLEKLLKAQSTLIDRTELGVGLAHYAAVFGSHDCLSVLLEAGVNPDLKLSDNSLIHLATNAGEIGIIQSLIDSGANINARNNDKETALHIAASLGHLEICRILLDAGIKKEKRNNRNATAIFVAAENDQTAAMRLLYEEGAKFKFSKHNRQILLLRTIIKNELDTVEFLISKGAKADKKVYASSPIFVAAKNASGDIIRFLIDHGADANEKSDKGTTPLMLAAAGNYDGLIALIEKGAEVNTLGMKGVTALHMAVLKHQIDITQYLLDHGADPNVENPDGTPIMWLATEVGNRIGLNALISAGAICSMDEATALPIMEYAFRYDIPEIVEITLDQCLDAGFMFRDVFPSYWVAQYYRSEILSDLLVQHGFNPDEMSNPPLVDSKLLRNQIKLLVKSDAVYPTELHEKYGEFVANVEIIIDVDGSVIFPRIASNPASEMDRGILQALTMWKFAPLVHEGEPARARFILPLRFVPAPAQELVYEVETVEYKPQPIRQIAPTYPSALKMNRINGKVTIVFIVDEEGNVVAPRVESATHKEFMQPALEAIKRWKFSPGYMNGKAVKVRVRAPLIFRIR